MKDTTAARRYAKALYELANDSNSVDDVLQGLSNVKLALQATPKMKQILFSPLIKPDEKETLIRCVTSNKLILKFVTLLARRKRLDLLVPVYDHLLSLSDEVKGIHRVLVKTPVALNDLQKRAVEKALATSLGGSVTGRFEEARELIGGVWIKMGSKVLDATVRGRIDDLRHALVNSAN